MTVIILQYKYLLGEWMKLQAEIRRLHEAEGSIYQICASMADISRPPILMTTLYAPTLSCFLCLRISLDFVYEIENKPRRAPPCKDTVYGLEYHPTFRHCVQAFPAYEVPHSVIVVSSPSSSRSDGSSIVDDPAGPVYKSLRYLCRIPVPT